MNIASTRFARALSAAVLATGFFVATAHAQKTPAQVEADKLNEQGKGLFADKQYEAAYTKFHQASTLSAEARFFFNMCYALNFLERYADAISACEQVEVAGDADAKLKEKTQKALVSLREKAAAQGGAGGGQGTTPPPGPDGGGGTTAPPGPDGGGGPAPGTPPAQPGGSDPFVAAQAGPSSGKYSWSVGGQIDLLANGGIGKLDGGQIYGAGGAMVRLFANFIVNDAQQLGIQGYLAFGGLPPHPDDNPDGEGLGMGDIGGALFLHRALGGNMVLTPLAGLHLSVMQPQELSQGYISAGARAEVALGWIFGQNGEHAFSVTPQANIYFPSGGEVDDIPAEVYGFDKTRATFGIGVGYTYRFSTPFGSTPLITLE